MFPNLKVGDDSFVEHFFGGCRISLDQNIKNRFSFVTAKVLL
jgi:hypothetical protein